MELTLRHVDIDANGVRLHGVEAGTGPLVVLLHGFPDFWYTWRQQLPALVGAGLRVLALDQRGYNTSSKPRSVRAYDIDMLTADVAAVIEQQGQGRAVVVGHDWGGVIAWQLAMRRPDLVSKLVVLNAPHPAAFLRELRRPRQLLRSWYVFFFQLPWLPEAWMQLDDFAPLEAVLRFDPLRRGAFTPTDIHLYKQAYRQPGALTAMVNWYRAVFRRTLRDLRHQFPTTAAPTLLLWGQRDRYLSLELTKGLEPWVPRLTVQVIPGASHWIQHDTPQRVNQAILKFIADN
jgi:pimeloyl-ACP methyl ester carboxylesterase